jgi:hypothetical protein
MDEDFEVQDSADLRGIYEQITRRVQAPQLWLRDVLLCAAFSMRPLTVAELSAAVGVSASGEADRSSRQTLQTIRIAAPKELHGDLIRALDPLVYVEDNVVHLVHGTLRELIRNQPDVLSYTTRSTPGPSADSDQAAWRTLFLRNCLQIISIPELREAKGSAVTLAPMRRPFHARCRPPTALLPHSFASYARCLWLRHVAEAEAKGEAAFIKEAFSRIWDNKDARTWYLGGLSASQTQSGAESDPQRLAWELRLAASLGLVSIVESLLPSVNSADAIPTLQPALLVAIHRGDWRTVRAILDATGPDDALWLPAIETACKHGHPNLWRLILSWWSDRTGKQLSQDDLRSCLALVSSHGHWPVISEVIRAYPSSTSSLGREGVADLIKKAAAEGRDGVIAEFLQVVLDGQKDGRSSGGIQLRRDEGSTAEGNDETKKTYQDNDKSSAKSGLDNASAEENPEDRLSQQTEAKGETKLGDAMDEKQAGGDSSDEGKAWLSGALIEAAEHGSAAAVYLLAPHANIDYYLDGDKWTALHWAASCMSDSQSLDASPNRAPRC